MPSLYIVLCQQQNEKTHGTCHLSMLSTATCQKVVGHDTRRHLCGDTLAMSGNL